MMIGRVIDPWAQDEDKKDGSGHIGAPVPAKGHDTRHDQKCPGQNGKTEAGIVAVDEEQDQKDAEGVSRKSFLIGRRF